MAANVGKAVVNVEVRGPGIRAEALKRAAISHQGASSRIVIAAAQDYEKYLAGPVTE